MNINVHPKSCISWENLFENKYWENVMEEVSHLLMASPKEYYFEFYLHKRSVFNGNLICSNHDSDRKKVLFLLGDEANEFCGNRVNGYDVIFKTYLPGDDKKFIPIPVGFNSQVPVLPLKRLNDRKYTAFFSGNLNENRLSTLYKAVHPLHFLPKKIFIWLSRRPRVQKLLRIPFPHSPRSKREDIDIQFTSGFGEGLYPVDYACKLNNSIFALCPAGFVSRETFRIFEALRQGCIVVCESLPNHSFYKDAPFIVIKNWNNVLKRLEKIDKPTVQKKSLQYFESVLSETGVADYIMNNLNLP
ncbi:hypothetical protein ACJVDH_15020 [Pedobacter sp. AW1-32]|uniref:hypothetical protein n=1 Tax=Pedobacter sp. AW1-32 TaxID=3383026 RepID=UPI003FEF1C86